MFRPPELVEERKDQRLSLPKIPDQSDDPASVRDYRNCVGRGADGDERRDQGERAFGQG
jgi:hypothetical protein